MTPTTPDTTAAAEAIRSNAEQLAALQKNAVATLAVSSLMAQLETSARAAATSMRADAAGLGPRRARVAQLQSQIAALRGGK